jgi:hypothetical protein
MLHILMNKGIFVEIPAEPSQFTGSRQGAVNEQKGDFDKRAVCNQILDIISPVSKNAFLSIDKGNLAFHRGGICKSLIERHVTGSVSEGTDIDSAPPASALNNREINRLAGYFKAGIIFSLRHSYPFRLTFIIGYNGQLFSVPVKYNNRHVLDGKFFAALPLSLDRAVEQTGIDGVDVDTVQRIIFQTQ